MQAAGVNVSITFVVQAVNNGCEEAETVRIPDIVNCEACIQQLVTEPGLSISPMMSYLSIHAAVERRKRWHVYQQLASRGQFAMP